MLSFLSPGHKIHAYNLKNHRVSGAGQSLSLRLTGLWAPSIWNSIETFFPFYPPSFTILQFPFLRHLSCCFGEVFFFLTELLNCLTFERGVRVCVCMYVYMCVYACGRKTGSEMKPGTLNSWIFLFRKPQESPMSLFVDRYILFCLTFYLGSGIQTQVLILAFPQLCVYVCLRWTFHNKINHFEMNNILWYFCI